MSCTIIQEGDLHLGYDFSNLSKTEELLCFTNTICFIQNYFILVDGRLCVKSQLLPFMMVTLTFVVTFPLCQKQSGYGVSQIQPVSSKIN